MAKNNILNNLALKLISFRMWIQSAFLLLWLDPMGLRLHNICSPVFHCYSCPLAAFACPIGVLANFSALHLFPFIAIGFLILAGSLLGSIICGWACPFGFLQDLIAIINLPKFDLPIWTGYFRYAVLIFTVILIPYFFGEGHPLFICRLCPAGALEGALPNVASLAIEGKPIIWPSAVKLSILVFILAAMLINRRPWCRYLCPLGAIFSLFNRFSVFFLRFNPQKCSSCGRCHELCEYGLEPGKNNGHAKCTKCLECIKCSSGAVEVSHIFEKTVNTDAAVSQENIP